MKKNPIILLLVFIFILFSACSNEPEPEKITYKNLDYLTLSNLLDDELVLKINVHDNNNTNDSYKCDVIFRTNINRAGINLTKEEIKNIYDNFKNIDLIFDNEEIENKILDKNTDPVIEEPVEIILDYQKLIELFENNSVKTFELTDEKDEISKLVLCKVIFIYKEVEQEQSILLSIEELKNIYNEFKSNAFCLKNITLEMLENIFKNIEEITIDEKDLIDLEYLYDLFNKEVIYEVKINKFNNQLYLTEVKFVINTSIMIKYIYLSQDQITSIINQYGKKEIDYIIENDVKTELNIKDNDITPSNLWIEIDEENKISFTEACNLYNENIVHKLKVLSKIENNETNLYFCSIDYYIEYIRYTKYVDLTKEELLYIVSTYSNCDFLTGITDIFDIDYDIKEELCIQELNGSLDLASNHPWFGWAPFKTAIYFSIVEKDEIYSEFKNENITAGYWIYIHDYKIDLSEVYKNEKLSNKEKAIKKAKIIAINEFIKNQNVNDKSTLIYFDSELKYDYFLEGSEYLYLLADAYLMLNQTSEKPTLSLNIRKDDRAMAFKDNKVDFSQLKENQKGVFSLYSYKDSLRSFYKQLNENMTVEEFKDWLEIVAELGPGSYYISCTEILMP